MGQRGSRGRRARRRAPRVAPRRLAARVQPLEPVAPGSRGVSSGARRRGVEGHDGMISSEVRTVDGVALSMRGERATGDARDVAVVVAHGFGASKDEPRVDAVARSLRAAGFSTVTYDARGHGESGGASTLGVLERHDVAAAADVARELAPRVVLVGASMGAIAVLGHAAGRDDVAGVVTVACPAAW